MNGIAPRVFACNLMILGNETHTLLHCPFSTHAQSAIQSHELNLRRFDLWARAAYTDTQKVAMLFGSILPKLDRQHKKAFSCWVLLISTCTPHIYSIQSHFRLARPPVPSSTSLPATTLFSPPPVDAHCHICQSPFDEHKMLLCDICNAGWHMDCLLPPLTTIYQFKKNCTLKHSHLNLGPTPTCTPMTWGQGLKPKSSAWFAMGGLGPSTQAVFSFGIFFLDFFFRGLVLADRSPPSLRVDFTDDFRL